MTLDQARIQELEQQLKIKEREILKLKGETLKQSTLRIMKAKRDEKMINVDDMTGTIDFYQDSEYIKIVKREQFFETKRRIKETRFFHNKGRIFRW